MHPQRNAGVGRTAYGRPGRRRQAGGGRWVLGIAALGVLGLGAFLVWTRSPGRASTETKREAPTAVTVPATLPVAPGASPEEVARLLAIAPELTERGAQMLLDDRTSRTAEAVAESTLGVASAGFGQLNRQDVAELSDLFSAVYASLSSQDRGWMATYVEKLRAASLTSAESRRGRQLFSSGVEALPGEKRLRLQALLERAIVAELQGRRAARDNRRLAANATSTPAPARPAGQVGLPAGRIFLDWPTQATPTPARSRLEPAQRPPAQSTPSEADLRRSAAYNELRARFGQMVGQANALIDTAQVYVQANCQAIQGVTVDSECLAMERRIYGLACAVGTSLDEVAVIARKGFLPPGIVREARESTGLNAKVWSDIQRLSRQHCTRSR